MRWAWATDITEGFPDGTFRPDEPLLRQAASVYLHRYVGSPDAPPTTFTDIGPDHPFHDAVSWMADAGITVGFPDGSFGATRDLLRQAYAAFVHRVHGSPMPSVLDPLPIDDVSPDDPDHDAIWWTLENDYLRFGKEGPLEGAFGPERTIRRREVLRVLHHHAGHPVPASPPGYPDPGFCDVTFGDFGWLPITWAADQGIVDTAPDCFRRIEPASRADTVRWFWRYDGAPTGHPDPGFTDVPVTHPDHPAVAWAVATGVVEATPGTSFGPDDPVSRREVARWFHRQVAGP
ncbi:MAG: S-layer homology domain-containing protein [Acidimicrobiia bacterium]|nr:S-layer homology domain-containing protein [Acidimicrobiia bacterium]